MDPYIILAKTEQGAWIETKEIGTNQWSLQQSSKIKQEQLILSQGEDSKKGQLIYLMRKGSFQVILYKMIRFLSGKLKKHTKLAKIVKISEIFNRLVFPLNFNWFCHPMTYASTELQCIEWLALKIIKYYGFGWEWHMSLPLNSKFTKIDKHVKYALEYSEHLVSKQFLILLINCHDIWSHLVLVGHRNALWHTR